MPYQIAFVNAADHGHVMPTLGAVTELVRRGHQVTYVTTRERAAPVAAAGAEVVCYESRIASVDPAAVFADEDPATPHLLYLEENLAILHAAERALDQTPPDLIAYGDFPFIAGRLLAARWQRPACRLSAGFASNGVYSFSQDMVAASGGISSEVQATVEARLAGMLAEYGVREAVPEFTDAIEDLTLVFIPREFQIAGDSFDERFRFVGRSPVVGGERWSPPGDGRRVVLISLGTTFNDNAAFFRECAEAFAATPWHVVMAVGDRVDAELLGALPSNVEAHRWVPYPAVLPHARVFVTHGGMGAVMDALAFGRPMVVVPHSFDVLPMARRVADLRLGALLRPEELSGEVLRKAVENVAGDGRMLERVRGMRACLHDAGGAVRAADELQAHLERS
jgi:MGT family glycosyltransferase